MRKDKIILSVPCQRRFAAIVESFVDILLPLLNGSASEHTAFELKVVLNEAFINVINHSSSDLKSLVEIMFEIEPHRLGIRFRDTGRGMPIHKHYPPYPEQMIGTSQVLLKTMDGKVIAYIKDNRTLILTFKENNIEKISSERLAELARDGGMGISLMTKIMDEVRFQYFDLEGNFLELIKEFYP